ATVGRVQRDGERLVSTLDAEDAARPGRGSGESSERDLLAGDDRRARRVAAKLFDVRRRTLDEVVRRKGLQLERALLDERVEGRPGRDVGLRDQDLHGRAGGLVLPLDALHV